MNISLRTFHFNTREIEIFLFLSYKVEVYKPRHPFCLLTSQFLSPHNIHINFKSFKLIAGSSSNDILCHIFYAYMY